MKKRYILLLVIVALIVFGSIIAYTSPALPVIQLPGECYPGTATGFEFFPCITNTLVTTIVAWLVVVIIALALRARSRTVDEIPTGFYNLFEAAVEAGMNFATNLAGTKKAKHFFPLFFTLIIYILISNWIELVPGVDSIGFYEWLPHLEAERAAHDRESAVESAEKELEDLRTADPPVTEVERLVLENEIAALEEFIATNEFTSEEQREHFVHDTEEIFDALNQGDFKDVKVGESGFIINAANRDNFNNPLCGTSSAHPEETGCDPENADWAVVAFFRAPATDLNFTLALALFTMVFVWYIGFRYLGPGYLRKFIPWQNNFDVMKAHPMKAMDWIVGILELVGEISRIISFSFRLLGNIFAGQVLLFVIAFILPVISVAFFGLELFVGLIQAVVFGLLALMFMTGASESHGDDHDEDH